jgi:hypothetical protein
MLAEQRLGTGDGPTHQGDAGGVFELATGLLDAQVHHFLAQLGLTADEFLD